MSFLCPVKSCCATQLWLPLSTTSLVRPDHACNTLHSSESTPSLSPRFSNSQIRWTSSMPTYAQLYTASSFSDFACPGNYTGVRCRAPDSYWSSDHLWYSCFIGSLDAHFKLGNEQDTSRSSSESRHTPATLDKVNVRNKLSWLSSFWEHPSSEMAITRRRPSCALAKGGRIFRHNQFSRTWDGWCPAATRRSRSRGCPSHRWPGGRDEG